MNRKLTAAIVLAISANATAQDVGLRAQVEALGQQVADQQAATEQLAEQVNELASQPGGGLVLVDANDEVVGSVVRIYNDPAALVYITVEDTTFQLTYNKDQIIGADNVVFEEPGCQGTPYVGPPGVPGLLPRTADTVNGVVYYPDETVENKTILRWSRKSLDGTCRTYPRYDPMLVRAAIVIFHEDDFTPPYRIVAR